MKFQRSEVVAVCEGLGFRVAGKWPKPKMMSRLGEIVEAGDDSLDQLKDPEQKELLSRIIAVWPDVEVTSGPAEASESEKVEVEVVTVKPPEGTESFVSYDDEDGGGDDDDENLVPVKPKKESTVKKAAKKGAEGKGDAKKTREKTVVEGGKVVKTPGTRVVGGNKTIKQEAKDIANASAKVKVSRVDEARGKDGKKWGYDPDGWYELGFLKVKGLKKRATKKEMADEIFSQYTKTHNLADGNYRSAVIAIAMAVKAGKAFGVVDVDGKYVVPV